MGPMYQPWKKSNLNDLYFFPIWSHTDVWASQSHHSHQFSMSLCSQNANKCQLLRELGQKEMRRRSGRPMCENSVEHGLRNGVAATLWGANVVEA